MKLHELCRIMLDYSLDESHIVNSYELENVVKATINHPANYHCDRWYKTFPNAWFIIVLATLMCFHLFNGCLKNHYCKYRGF